MIMTISQSSKPAKRNANIELLRILSTLCIIMSHITFQAGFNHYQRTVSSVLISLFSCAGNIAVNLFLMIGVFYMSDTAFSGKRILSIWSQVFFYTSLITALVTALGFPVPLKELLRGYFPFAGRALWFASAYITLLLVTPFLNKVFLWDIKQQNLFLVILFAAMCLVSSMPGEVRTYLSDSLWFWFVYLAMGCYKRHCLASEGVLKNHRGLLLFLSFLLYLMLCLIFHFTAAYSPESCLARAMNQISFQYISDIKSLPSFLCAFLIFNYVIQCRERTSKVIQTLASSSFSVYIIHQVPAFIPVLWGRICRIQTLIDKPWSVRYLILIAVSVYAAVSLIDLPRRMLETRWQKSSLFQRAAAAIERQYRNAKLLD